MRKKYWFGMSTICLLAIFILSIFTVAQGHDSAEAYFSFVDQEGNFLMQTAQNAHKGDLYIAPDNKRYIVETIGKDRVQCRYDGIETMPVLQEVVQEAGIFPDGSKKDKENKKPKEWPTVAIYHTHDDESYISGDGRESIRGDGGICDVGDVLKEELEKMGFQVMHSEARHDPHDINAYNRSRETAAALMREGGDILIDVHRDAVPPENYETEIDGEPAAKIKLVVGKSNPNQQSNMEFAKYLKAAMDQTEPGLSAGIYEGKGDYNQDLNPRAILIEVGAHTNDKEEAKKGAAAFAQAMPLALGVQKNNDKEKTSSTAAKENTENSNQKSDSPKDSASDFDSPNTGEAGTKSEEYLTNEAQENGQEGKKWNVLWILLLLVGSIAGIYYFTTQSRS